MDKILKIQEEIGVLSKDKENPFFKSKYLDINQIIANLLPLLKKYELLVMQPLTHWDGRPAIATNVYDVSEEGKKNGNRPIHSDLITMPDISDPQKMGSSVTYYRRYSLQSLFLLQAEDDDGNSAKGEVVLKMGKKERDAKNKADKENNVDPLLDDDLDL